MDVDLAFGLSLAVVFVAAFVRSTFGFGDALLAMPFLVMLLGARAAAPLMAIVALLLGSSMLLRYRGKVRPGLAIRLVIPTLAGIPLGITLLRSVEEGPLKVALGVLVVAFAVFKTVRPTSLRIESERWAWAFGLVAGVFGGAYNTNGPIIVFYGALRGWRADDFRATLQAYFVATGVLTVAGHFVAGHLTVDVLTRAAATLPLLVVAATAGAWVARRLPVERFLSVVYVLLGLAGVLLLASVAL